MMTWKMFRDNFGKKVTYFGSQSLNLIQLNLIIMDFISIVKAFLSLALVLRSFVFNSFCNVLSLLVRRSMVLYNITLEV